MTVERLDLRASIQHARAVADAVLYEGYLLYPYRASAGKNRIRWQFGVLGPRGAAGQGIGEDSTMTSEFLIRVVGDAATRVPRFTVLLRFLQRQTRSAEQRVRDAFEPIPEITVDGRRWLSWDEAVECELEFGSWSLSELGDGRREPISYPGGEDVELLHDTSGEVAGRLVRRRADLSAEIAVETTDVGNSCWQVRLSVDNTSPPRADKESAISVSFIGTHLILVAEGADFLSSTDPPLDAIEQTAALKGHRCWPVLAGPPEESRILLVSPIIVEDHAELAPQSAGALFDSTEIDEILTLRVMTLTDEEKAEARATDPRAADIIDRCDQMTPQQMQDLHGILRDPHGMAARLSSVAEPFGAPGLESYDLPDDLVFSTEAPWWDPAADANVSPETDSVVIDGFPVTAGSIVRVAPNRRADAQDLFYRGMTARVTAVLNDVDGDTHVAVVLLDDPAAEMHDWYGRYLYFAPDELIPLNPADANPPGSKGDPG
ncbi:MAG: hypothetical protein ABJA86_06455 [Nocardioidaceae bacterium]